MKIKRKMTLAHAVIIALVIFVLLSTLQAFGVINLSYFSYNLCSWIGLLTLSIIVAWCFNTQPGIIKFFIFVFVVVFLLVLYTIMAQINPSGIPYINAMGLGICCSLVVCIIYATLSQSNSAEKREYDSKLDDPQRLIQSIYNGRYSSREDLFRFYINYTSKKDTFIDLLNVICDVCKDASTNENIKDEVREMCKIVLSIVNPILVEERKMDYLSNLKGKERSALLTLHNYIIELEDSNKALAIQNISYIADLIDALQLKLKEENKRNTQSLTISIVGILLTVIFSLLSFLTADKYSALSAYMKYFKQ